VELVAVIVPVAIAAVAGGWIAAGPAVGLAALVAATVAAGVSWVGLRGRYLSWGYLERGGDLVVRRGLIVRRLSVVPYGRMQYVDVTAGPVERVLRLATVRLHTAAAATDARIPGLDLTQAESLRDRLASLGEPHRTGL
jgi:hypothetical protein